MGHAAAAGWVRMWRPPRRRCRAPDFGRLHARSVLWESILYQETVLVKSSFLAQSTTKRLFPFTDRQVLQNELLGGRGGTAGHLVAALWCTPPGECGVLGVLWNE